jgi:hypothetical protein
MAFGPPQVVEAQPRVGLPHGLFSVLTLRNADDPHWANGIEWEAMSCSPVTALSTFDNPDCSTQFNKQFAPANSRGSAFGFGVYGSAKCGTPGGRIDQKAEEFATADLLAHEEKQAEFVVWKRMAAQATDLHPSGALDPLPALSALEEWMGDVYGSLGVIAGSRGVVSLWSQYIKASGSRLLSQIGTPIAAGAGFPGTSPAGAAAAAGEAWVFASPALFGYRGEVFTASALDRNKNDFYAMSERNYVIGFDPCGVGAVRMNID